MKFLKNVAKNFGVLVGKIQYRKFKPTKILKNIIDNKNKDGKLFDDEIFEELKNDYEASKLEYSKASSNVNTSQSSVNNDFESDMYNFLSDFAENSANTRAYNNLITTIKNNNLEEKVSDFIFENAGLIAEESEDRFEILNSYVSRLVKIKYKDLDNLTLRELTNEYVSNINLENDDVTKLKNKISIIENLINSTNNKFNSSKGWIIENLDSDNKNIDELISTLNDEIKKNIEREFNKYSNNIVAANTVDLLMSVSDAVMKWYESYLKNGIDLSKKCKELMDKVDLKMAKIEEDLKEKESYNKVEKEIKSLTEEIENTDDLNKLQNLFQKIDNIYSANCDAIENSNELLAKMEQLSEILSNRIYELKKLQEESLLEEIKEYVDKVNNLTNLKDLEILFDEMKKWHDDNLEIINNSEDLIEQVENLENIINEKKNKLKELEISSKKQEEKKQDKVINKQVENIDEKTGKKVYGNLQSLKVINELVKLSVSYLSYEELEKATKIYDEDYNTFTIAQREDIKLLLSETNRILNELSLKSVNENSYPVMEERQSFINNIKKDIKIGDMTLSNELYKVYCEKIKVALKYNSKTILDVEEELFEESRRYLTIRQVEDIKLMFENARYNMKKNNESFTL